MAVRLVVLVIVVESPGHDVENFRMPGITGIHYLEYTQKDR
jgi:hypothetical protein